MEVSVGFSYPLWDQIQNLSKLSESDQWEAKLVEIKEAWGH